MLVTESDLPGDVEALQRMVLDRDRAIEVHEQRHEAHEQRHEAHEQRHEEHKRHNLLRDELLAGELVLCDETCVQVLDEAGRPATSQSYVWVQQSGGGSPAVTLFDDDPSRSADVPKRLLEGFEGYLHTDGYAGYDGVAAENEIIHVGCWAHTRRKFDEALKAQQRSSKKKRLAKASTTTQALTFIRKLYAIEKQIAKKPPDERHRIRQEQSKPIIDKMRRAQICIA